MAQYHIVCIVVSLIDEMDVESEDRTTQFHSTSFNRHRVRDYKIKLVFPKNV